MKENIFITSYAKLPQGTIAHEMYGGLILAMVVERSTGEILEVECSLATTLANDFIREIIVGGNLMDLDEMSEIIKDRYHGSAKKAVLSALNLSREKYLQIREEDANK